MSGNVTSSLLMKDDSEHVTNFGCEMQEMQRVNVESSQSYGPEARSFHSILSIMQLRAGGEYCGHWL